MQMKLRGSVPNCWVNVPPVPLPTVWPWPRYVTSLGLGLHNHQIRIIKEHSSSPHPSYRVVLRIQ